MKEQNLISEPSDVWEKRLNSLFSENKKTVEQQFLDIVSIILHQSTTNSDLSNLYACLDFNSFIKVIDLFDGRTVTFPEKEELKDAIELALYFYYKEVKGIKSYDKLKKLDIRDDKVFSAISIGRKINNLKEGIVDVVVEALKELKE